MQIVAKSDTIQLLKKDPAEAGPVGTWEVSALVRRIAPAMLADEL
ncbi:hypothetical protein BQ8794_40380 [Mesorhizobium prunaredense]|uniref:Uncharacterized protein n=1 Tax=Mesorhizobium prunaredense TaxID=1631249 RepID=A0A1R3VD52_9HYPH|nr:hypothetical protein BQ8794_40380 [Mesorhizobium prunaredense]